MSTPIWDQMWRERRRFAAAHHRRRAPDPEETSAVTDTLPQPPNIRYPRSAQPAAVTARQVAAAYNCPITQFDGTGTTVGIIELGGAFSPSDLTKAGLDPSKVTIVGVDGGAEQPDPQGADGEVELDIEVVAAVAPGAAIRVYFASNTDRGFTDAVKQAASECDTVSISWGGPETQWSTSSIKTFSAVLATARAAGVPVFVAAGDNGSTDGTRSNVVDYPASDPSSVGCGGTRLTLNDDGSRAAEVVWNDNPTQSATGGGVSKTFPGRQVPDIAGNADPDSGYEIVVDGQASVIGGTSAVAPLYAGCFAVIKQASGGKVYDFVNIVQTNPTICFDVTSGNNGGYKAGPGRDDVSGFGVVDWSKLLTVLTSGTQVPAPGGGTGGGTTTTDPKATLLEKLEAFFSAELAEIKHLLGS